MADNIALKSILGIMNLAFLMASALFVSAGSLYYLYAYLYLAIFFAGVIIITVYIYRHNKRLLESRLHVGPMAENRLSQKIIQSIASIGFIAMYVIAGLDYRFSWSNVPPWLSYFSNIMLIPALSILFAVFKKNSFLAATVAIQENQTVISDGPYAVVRHPMYSAALLLFFFSPLALGSLWSLSTFPLILALLVLRCLDEEKLLASELDGYTKYCHKVRFRLIPFIW